MEGAGKVQPEGFLKRDRARHDAIRSLASGDVAAGNYDIVILPEGAQDE